MKCCVAEEYEEMKVSHRAALQVSFTSWDFLALEYTNVWARKLGFFTSAGFLNG